MKWKPFVDAGRIRNKGRYDGEVRHRRIRPQHLCAEIYDRTAVGGRNQAVYFGRNLLGAETTPAKRKGKPSPSFRRHIYFAARRDRFRLVWTYRQRSGLNFRERLQ